MKLSFEHLRCLPLNSMDSADRYRQPEDRREAWTPGFENDQASRQTHQRNKTNRQRRKVGSVVNRLASEFDLRGELRDHDVFLLLS